MKKEASQDARVVKGENYMATTKKTAATENKTVKTGATKATVKKAATAKTGTAKTDKAETKATKTAKTATKTTAKTAVKVNVNIQFNNKSYTTEDLVKIAKDVWRYDLKKKVSDFKTVELYVKPEEGMAYYVINGTEEGSFVI